jgi:DNA-binding NarL/FixJ family response regulator
VIWLIHRKFSLLWRSRQPKVYDMTIEHMAYSRHSDPSAMGEIAEPRFVARYRRELAKREDRLRAALAREEGLLRQNAELIRQQEVLSKLLALREDAATRVAGLTPRQRQVMELVLAGHPSKNIAADLDISQRTVENHRAAIMMKTGTKSLPALSRLALAAAWNGAGEPLRQPLARLALAAVWNGAEKSLA